MADKESGPVLAAVDDLFFVAKIESAAKILGVELIQARNAEHFERALTGRLPRLILFDLNCKGCQPLEVIRRLKGDDGLRSIPVVGFFSHVQTELERAAREAGCDYVVPRSRFSADLPQILEIDRVP